MNFAQKSLATLDKFYRDSDWRWMPAIFWYAVIFTLSQIPGAASAGTEEIFHDWNAVARMIAHAGFFAILAQLVYCAFARTVFFRWNFYVLAVFVNALLGLSDEIHQYFVPFRHFRLIDITVDFLGGATFIPIFCVVSLYFLNKKADITE